MRIIGLCSASLVLAGAVAGSRPAWAQTYDPAKYMRTDELRRGMRGFGRTVLAGTEIVRFEVEIVSVLRNSFYAGQDVILVRCKGAGLEHSGIIGGMSGSPVYITDDAGQNPRMIGAIAYGWSFNKDPIGGVQPIHQMLSVQGVTDTQPTTRPAARASTRRPRIPAAAESRLATLFPQFARTMAGDEAGRADAGAFKVRPLVTPLMVGGASPQTLSFLREQLAECGFEPVASGGMAATEFDPNVKMEPGSALCVPILTGDLRMAALGTCTEVIGDRVLGFGHSFFADGPVEMPMAVGAVHTVIPSVMRSTKLGTFVSTVGTLIGDENTGIVGRLGPTPRMIPCEVTIKEPGRERQYHYESIQHEYFTPTSLATAVLESVYAHVNLPREHTIRYSIEIAFEGLGTFKSSNVASQSGVFPMIGEILFPTMALMDNEFGRAKVDHMKVDVAVEPAAKTAYVDRMELLRDRVKPGATVAVKIEWRRYREPPTVGHYTLKLPDDLPEGNYELTVGSAMDHLQSLQSEKPYLFDPRSMKEMIEAFNLASKYQEDHVYLRIRLPTGGVNVGKDVLPELPSYRQRIVADSKRTDVGQYVDAIVAEHPVPFTVSGSRTFSLQVDKRADQ